MSYKIEAGTIITKLRTDRKAAARFVQDPAAEWQAQGGHFPAGVSASQFSRGIRQGKLFEDIKAVAEGKSHSNMGWSPCTMAVMFLFDALGVTAAVAVTLATGGANVGVLAALATTLGMEVTAIRAAILTVGHAPLAMIAAAICHGA